MPRVAAAESVLIPIPEGQIAADLRIPARPTGLVIFAHGSGSSRFSSRNRAVAASLEATGFATLLLDLLTQEEEAIDLRTREYRFDIERLGRRMVVATDWTQQRSDLGRLPVGSFGASTGAAAALISAAERPAVTRAVVSRGGRPDLAARVLPRVTSPTLLVVGGDDQPVVDMNREAMRQMTAAVSLEIVPGATHLFEEAGTLEQVMHLAASWFSRHLTAA